MHKDLSMVIGNKKPTLYVSQLTSAISQTLSHWRLHSFSKWTNLFSSRFNEHLLFFTTSIDANSSISGLQLRAPRYFQVKAGSHSAANLLQPAIDCCVSAEICKISKLYIDAVHCKFAAYCDYQSERALKRQSFTVRTKT